MTIRTAQTMRDEWLIGLELISDILAQVNVDLCSALIINKLFGVMEKSIAAPLPFFGRCP
jgi:hypothetical protein